MYSGLSMESWNKPWWFSWESNNRLKKENNYGLSACQETCKTVFTERSVQCGEGFTLRCQCLSNLPRRWVRVYAPLFQTKVKIKVFSKLKLQRDSDRWHLSKISPKICLILYSYRSWNSYCYFLTLENKNAFLSFIG